MNYFDMLNRVAYQNAMIKQAAFGNQFGFGSGVPVHDEYKDYAQKQKDSGTAEKDIPGYSDWAKRNKNLVEAYDKATSDAALGSYISGGATMAGVTGLAGLAGDQIPWLRNRKFLKWLLAGGIGAASAIPVAHYVGKANALDAVRSNKAKESFTEARKKDVEDNAAADAEEAAKNSGGE